MQNNRDYHEKFGNRTCSMKLASSVSDQNVYLTYVCLVNEVRQLAGNDNDVNSMNQDRPLHVGAYEVSNGVFLFLVFFIVIRFTRYILLKLFLEIFLFSTYLLYTLIGKFKFHIFNFILLTGVPLAASSVFFLRSF